MTSNIHSVSQNQASFARSLHKMVPLAVTVLVWLFAASLETGFVAFVNAGIQPVGQTLGTA